MAILPIGRNTTYTSGAPVNSVDLNDIQDCIIGSKHGLLTFKKQFLAGSAVGAFIDGQNLFAGDFFTIPMDGLIAGETIMGCDSLVVAQSGSPVYRLSLFELIRAPGNSPPNANNNPANSANSATTLNLNQRLVIGAGSLNNGAGVPVRSDAIYFLVMSFVSGSSYSFVVQDARWAVQRT